jgi:hypothetical protein
MPRLGLAGYVTDTARRPGQAEDGQPPSWGPASKYRGPRRGMWPHPAPSAAPADHEAALLGRQAITVIRDGQHHNQRQTNIRPYQRVGARLFGRFITSSAFRPSWTSAEDGERVLDIYPDRRVPVTRAMPQSARTWLGTISSASAASSACGPRRTRLVMTARPVTRHRLRREGASR